MAVIPVRWLQHTVLCVMAYCTEFMPKKYPCSLRIELCLWDTVEKSLQLLCVPLATTEPIYHGQSARDYLLKHVNPVLTKGLTELCKEKPKDPLVRQPRLLDQFSRVCMKHAHNTVLARAKAIIIESIV